MRTISQTSPAKDFTPTPRRGVNVSHFLTQTARRLPERLAVVDDDHGQRWTWAELDARAEALAAALQAGGVGRRDTVLLLSANHAEVIQSFWGILRAGGVIAPPNAALSTEELLGISAEVAPAAVIADRAHSDFVTALVAEGFTGPVLWIGELPSSSGPLRAEGTGSNESSTRSGPLGARPRGRRLHRRRRRPLLVLLHLRIDRPAQGRDVHAPPPRRGAGEPSLRPLPQRGRDRSFPRARAAVARGGHPHARAGLRRHPVDHPPWRQAQPGVAVAGHRRLRHHERLHRADDPQPHRRRLPGRTRTRGPHLGAHHLRRCPDARRRPGTCSRASRPLSRPVLRARRGDRSDHGPRSRRPRPDPRRLRWHRHLRACPHRSRDHHPRTTQARNCPSAFRAKSAWPGRPCAPATSAVPMRTPNPSQEASSTPATSATSTRPATCSSPAGSRICTSPADRTSIRARSKNSSSPTPRWPRPSSSACPIRSGERSAWPSSNAHSRRPVPIAMALVRIWPSG